MKTLGIAGTAKNTGKTTTALEIIRQSVERGLTTALTSIGYDGEEKDHITGLPKPRYWLPRGMIVATAERCLSAGTAGYVEKVITPVRTALGPVVVAEIDEPGLVLVAGPNRATELQSVLEIFDNLGADLAIADGALNRCVPLIRTDGLVLATGAALDERVACVAEHAAAIGAIFAPRRALDAAEWGRERISFRSEGVLTELETGSLLSEETALQIARRLRGAVQDLVIPGACDPRLMERLLDFGAGRLVGARILLGSPLKLLASGNPTAWSGILSGFQRGIGRVEYLETIPLLLMTVNPFYPRYEPDTGNYQPAYVDGPGLLDALRCHLPGLVMLNIKQNPDSDLLSLLHVAVS